MQQPCAMLAIMHTCLDARKRGIGKLSLEISIMKLPPLEVKAQKIFIKE